MYISHHTHRATSTLSINNFNTLYGSKIVFSPGLINALVSISLSWYKNELLIFKLSLSNKSFSLFTSPRIIFMPAQSPFIPTFSFLLRQHISSLFSNSNWMQQSITFSFQMCRASLGYPGYSCMAWHIYIPQHRPLVLDYHNSTYGNLTVTVLYLMLANDRSEIVIAAIYTTKLGSRM